MRGSDKSSLSGKLGMRTGCHVTYFFLSLEIWESCKRYFKAFFQFNVGYDSEGKDLKRHVSDKLSDEKKKKIYLGYLFMYLSILYAYRTV